METRAPFIFVGAFLIAAIGAVFGFVYWLHNTGGLGPRADYHIQFNGPVPGLLVGAGVLFNGIRVGDVTNLGLAVNNTHQVNATVSVSTTAPVRADTKVGLEFQGLTGVPVITLEGGDQVTASGQVFTLVADQAATQSMTQAARNALGRMDAVLADNAEPLKAMIANLKTFSDGLAKNTGGLDSIVAGLVKMTGGGEPSLPKTIYDLRVPQDFAVLKRPITDELVMPTPTATLLLDTQRWLLTPSKVVDGFENAWWADTIPKMLQTKLLQSFENYDIAHAPIRAAEVPSTDPQLVIDLRTFQINTGGEMTAEIGFSARIVDKDGKIIAAHLFSQTRKLNSSDPASAVDAFNGAFAAVATDLITWTADVL